MPFDLLLDVCKGCFHCVCSLLPSSEKAFKSKGSWGYTSWMDMIEGQAQVHQMGSIPHVWASLTDEHALTSWTGRASAPASTSWSDRTSGSIHFPQFSQPCSSPAFDVSLTCTASLPPFGMQHLLCACSLSKAKMACEHCPCTTQLTAVDAMRGRLLRAWASQWSCPSTWVQSATHWRART